MSGMMVNYICGQISPDSSDSITQILFLFQNTRCPILYGKSKILEQNYSYGSWARKTMRCGGVFRLFTSKT